VPRDGPSAHFTSSEPNIPVLWRKRHKTIEARNAMFGMPRAVIKSKQAIYTLSQLHAELAGKFLENSRQRVRLKTAMMQVEAVLLMLQPGFKIKSIAAKRRNKSNPWFKRGTLFRSAVDVLRRAGTCPTFDGGYTLTSVTPVSLDDSTSSARNLNGGI
jgi:hypothetical protein